MSDVFGRMRRVSIEMGGLGDPEIIMCPRCGGDYLHQETVSVFNRGEDAQMVHRTRVYPEGGMESGMAMNTSENPSSRRSGMTISFSCENCDQYDKDGEHISQSNLELCIEQHKGNTYIYWRFPD